VRGSSNNTTALKETSPAVGFANVFPNPIANNDIQFEMVDNSKDFTAQIIDIQGRVLFNKTFKSYQYNPIVSISEPFLNAGIYWLSLESGGQKMVKKIVLVSSK
jgi:Secretion system C-terminal sorting domain